MNGNARVLRISDGGARGGLKTDRSWEFWKLKVRRALESMREGESRSLVSKSEVRRDHGEREIGRRMREGKG